MNAETFLVEHLADVHRAIAFVCRRHDLRGADAEDFGSLVTLKIIDNDYAVIRKFESRCTFQAYMVIVATRILLDERNHELGKWRPSTEARRLGDMAILLETLLHRDKRTLAEAIESIQGRGTAITRQELEQIAAQLPTRRIRPRQVSLDAATERVAVSGDTVIADAEAGDRLAMARKIATVLRGAMDGLPEEDRVIMRMRFEAGMTVAEIARALQIPQKPVYRLLTTHFKTLRRVLEGEGIHARDVEDVVGIDETPLDRGFVPPGTQATPTLGEE